MGIYQFLQFYRLLKKWHDASIVLPRCESLAVTHFHSCHQNLVDYCYYSIEWYKTRKFQNYCCCFQSFEIMGHSKIMNMKDHSQPELDSHNSDVFIANSDVFGGWYSLKCMQPFHRASHALNGMWCLGS